MNSNESTKPGKRRWVLALAAVTLLASATAIASNFGPGGGIFYANGRTHYIRYEKLTTGFTNASNYARKNAINPTDVNTRNAADHYSADAVVYDYSYGDTGWSGIVDCLEKKNDRVCKHWHVRYNQSYGPYTRRQKRFIACHELGHTLGLRHRWVAGTCMNYDWVDVDYNRHDRRHLNNRY